MTIKWTNIEPNDYNSYPKEGVSVLVSDTIHYDVAWYLMSSTYKWMKSDLVLDDVVEFNQFNITKWAYINDLK